MRSRGHCGFHWEPDRQGWVGRCSPCDGYVVFVGAPGFFHYDGSGGAHGGHGVGVSYCDSAKGRRRSGGSPRGQRHRKGDTYTGGRQVAAAMEVEVGVTGPLLLSSGMGNAHWGCITASVGRGAGGSAPRPGCRQPGWRPGGCQRQKQRRTAVGCITELPWGSGWGPSRWADRSVAEDGAEGRAAEGTRGARRIVWGCPSPDEDYFVFLFGRGRWSATGAAETEGGPSTNGGGIRTDSLDMGWKRRVPS